MGKALVRGFGGLDADAYRILMLGGIGLSTLLVMTLPIRKIKERKRNILEICTESWLSVRRHPVFP